MFPTPQPMERTGPARWPRRRIDRASLQSRQDPVIDPSAFCESAWIGCGSRIDAGAYVGASAELGRSCRIGEGAAIPAARLADAVVVEAGARILGAVTIGARARICAGVTLSRNVPPGALVRD